MPERIGASSGLGLGEAAVLAGAPALALRSALDNLLNRRGRV